MSEIEPFEHCQCASCECHGGRGLKALGYEEDVAAAARIDEFALVPELKPDPLRIEVGAVGIAKSYWTK